MFDLVCGNMNLIEKKRNMKDRFVERGDVSSVPFSIVDC